MIGWVFQETNGSGSYARSMNLERTLRKAYDDKLNEYDVLLMPTLPYVAPKLPEQELPMKGTHEIVPL